MSEQQRERTYRSFVTRDDRFVVHEQGNGEAWIASTHVFPVEDMQ